MTTSITFTDHPTPATGPNDQALADKADRGTAIGSDLTGTPSQPSQKVEPKPEPTDTAPSTATTETPTLPPEAASKVNLAELETEYNTSGKLSEATYKSLETKGFTKDDVDRYIAARTAAAEAEVSKMLSPYGGQEGFNQMAEWAQANLPKETVAEYNKLLATNPKVALKALSADYRAANGSGPGKVLSGHGNAGGAVAPYTSTAQMTKDMRDKRYATDPAFRAQVERRIAASTF